ncbi:hypothetical protein PSEMO_46160 [Pseudomonas putida]|uniref:Uncharacterized protein n=2 Tax=Pseudomonas putida TaxID=303 RepID=A0A1Q9QZC3_PSEPU|nr:hypothetical protein PSEMO_46160 [Pseudomonas putida]
MPCQSSVSAKNLITKWMEDETFYSICSRQHYLLGCPTSASMLNWLFNSSSATTTHDLPYNLLALNSAAKKSWGDPRSIILEHTILPLFLPFQSSQHATQALSAMKSPTLGSLKYKLGLLTGRFGAEHPLKACMSCMEADFSNHGFTYWHLTHQFPGVLVCPIHGEQLRESCYNRQWSRRLQWVLPIESTLAPIERQRLPQQSSEALMHLATAVLDLAAWGRVQQFRAEIVRAIYRQNLCIEPQKKAISFANYCKLIQPYPPLRSLPSTPQHAQTFWAQLIRNRHGHSHPLKHLAVITWLYGSVRTFIEAYDHAVFLHTSDGPSQEDQLPAAVVYKTGSQTQDFIQPINRKPKILKPEIRANILKRLRCGEEKNLVCEIFGITVSTLNKLLRSEPDVRQTWLKERAMAKVKEHRAIWVAAMNHDPKRSPKEIRECLPGVYAWLYRNDLEWLLSRTREMPSGRRGNHASVDWARRDEALLELVELKVLELKETEPSRKIIRSILFFTCPPLAPALENRHRYPRTRAYLKGLI